MSNTQGPGAECSPGLVSSMGRGLCLDAGKAVGTQAETKCQRDEAEHAVEREVGTGIGQCRLAGGTGEEDRPGLGWGGGRRRGGSGVSSGQGYDRGFYLHA